MCDRFFIILRMYMEVFDEVLEQRPSTRKGISNYWLGTYVRLSTAVSEIVSLIQKFFAFY